MHGYSVSHVRETHVGWQCADRRNINNRDNALYTHNTGPKSHNHTSGDEIIPNRLTRKSSHAVYLESGRLETQGLGSLRPIDPGSPNGHPQGIQRVRIF